MNADESGLNTETQSHREDHFKSAFLFLSVSLCLRIPLSYPRSSAFICGYNPSAMKHTPGFLKIVDDARSRVRECTVADVKQKLDRGDKFHLVDVREESEWAAGHLPKARHLGKGVIERDVETKIPDTNAEIVLYC